MRCASIVLFCILECLIIPVIAPILNLSPEDTLAQSAKAIGAERETAFVTGAGGSEVVGSLSKETQLLDTEADIDQRLAATKSRSPITTIFKTLSSSLRKWVSQLKTWLRGRSIGTFSRNVKLERPPPVPEVSESGSKAESSDSLVDFDKSEATKAKEALKGDTNVAKKDFPTEETSSVEAGHVKSTIPPGDQGAILGSPIVNSIGGTAAEGSIQISEIPGRVLKSESWEWMMNTNTRFLSFPRLRYTLWSQPKNEPLEGLKALSELPSTGKPYKNAQEFITHVNNDEYVKNFLDSYKNLVGIRTPIKKYLARLEITQPTSGSEVVKSPKAILTQEVTPKIKSDPIHAENSNAETSSSSKSEKTPSTKEVTPKQLPTEEELLKSIRKVYNPNLSPGYLTPSTQKLGDTASNLVTEEEAEKIHAMAKLLYLLANANSHQALDELSSLGQTLAVTREAKLANEKSSPTQLNQLKVFVKTALEKLDSLKRKNPHLT